MHGGQDFSDLSSDLFVHGFRDQQQIESSGPLFNGFALFVEFFDSIHIDTSDTGSLALIQMVDVSNDADLY